MRNLIRPWWTRSGIHARPSIQAWLGACLVLPVVLASPALAQQAVPPATPTAQAPALNPRPDSPAAPATEEGRVHLDVVVTDKAGKPVSGLALEDFKLEDNNLPAKILSFHAINAAVEKAVRPADVILLIDTVDEDFQSVARTREEIVRFLRQNGGHLAQPVSIFVFRFDGVKVLQQPSLDGNALATQLAQTELGLREMGRSAGENGAIERFDLAIKWIGVVADRIGKAPGRKLLIWTGPGWPLLDQPNINMSSKGQQQMFDELVHLSTTLRESHMALYSVSIGDPTATTYLYQGFLKGVKTAEKINPPNLSLKVLATESGGRVMSPNNDVAGQISTCVQDGSAFYTLSFDPPRADRANEYHDLKVEVDKPGLTARTSTGYYNQP